MSDVVARAVLWGMVLFGALSALALAYAADANGRPSLLRWGSGAVVMAGVAAAGLWLSRPSGRMTA